MLGLPGLGVRSIGESAAVPPGGGGPELQALPPPDRCCDQEEGRTPRGPGQKTGVGLFLAARKLHAMRWRSWPRSRRACSPCQRRKVNLERFREQYLEGRSADAGKALTEAMGSVTEAQAAAHPGGQPSLRLDVSVWPVECHRRGTSRRSISPSSSSCESQGIRGRRRNCWRRWRWRPIVGSGPPQSRWWLVLEGGG